MKQEKILISGLGGGLDVVNCLPLYYKLQAEGHDVSIGSIRPAPISSITAFQTSYEQWAVITENSKIDYKGRYAEPLVAKIINAPILFLSRSNDKGKNDVKGLNKTIKHAIEYFRFTKVYFVDGGGDSMILTEDFGIEKSQEIDPFKGGDAFALEAIQDIDCTLCTVAVGLDIDRSKFLNNLDNLTERGIYLGSENIKETYDLTKYFEVADQILRINKEDKEKYMSHTGVVFYHALKGSYGRQRTFVQWEGTFNGEKGVEVIPGHTMMYMFKGNEIHKLKLELNKI